MPDEIFCLVGDSKEIEVWDLHRYESAISKTKASENITARFSQGSPMHEDIMEDLQGHGQSP